MFMSSFSQGSSTSKAASPSLCREAGHHSPDVAGAALGVQVTGVVRNYSRLNPWIQLDDLKQEAYLASLTSDPGWEPRCAALALSRYVAEQRVPVSLPKSKGASWREAATATRVELDDDLPELAETPEDRIDRERALARIRVIMSEQAEAARLVLLAEEKSAAVAARLGVSVREVYHQTRVAMRALRAAFAMEEA